MCLRVDRVGLHVHLCEWEKTSFTAYTIYMYYKINDIIHKYINL